MLYDLVYRWVNAKNKPKKDMSRKKLQRLIQWKYSGR